MNSTTPPTCARETWAACTCEGFSDVSAAHVPCEARVFAGLLFRYHGGGPTKQDVVVVHSSRQDTILLHSMQHIQAPHPEALGPASHSLLCTLVDPGHRCIKLVGLGADAAKQNKTATAEVAEGTHYAPATTCSNPTYQKSQFPIKLGLNQGFPLPG